MLYSWETPIDGLFGCKIGKCLVGYSEKVKSKIPSWIVRRLNIDRSNTLYLRMNLLLMPMLHWCFAWSNGIKKTLFKAEKKSLFQRKISPNLQWSIDNVSWQICFFFLFREGKIYKPMRMSFWCCHCYWYPDRAFHYFKVIEISNQKVCLQIRSVTEF